MFDGVDFHQANEFRFSPNGVYYMQFERGTLSDAEEMSALIHQLSGPFYSAPNCAGAEVFKNSISVCAMRGYLQAPNFSYWVARCPAGTLAGFIAMRDQTHLFQFFVAEPFQRQGLGRQLWQRARMPSAAAGFTVNASLRAIPVYERFGFEKQGAVKVEHGVTFQPMRLGGA